MNDPNPKGISLHIPVLIFLQICFIILFGVFTRYVSMFIKPHKLFYNYSYSRYDYQAGFKHQNHGDYGEGADNAHNMTLKIYTSMNWSYNTPMG